MSEGRQKAATPDSKPFFLRKSHAILWQQTFVHRASVDSQRVRQIGRILCFFFQKRRAFSL
jgi:hypothetical protein